MGLPDSVPLEPGDRPVVRGMSRKLASEGCWDLRTLASAFNVSVDEMDRFLWRGTGGAVLGAAERGQR